MGQNTAAIFRLAAQEAAIHAQGIMVDGRDTFPPQSPEPFLMFLFISPFFDLFALRVDLIQQFEVSSAFMAFSGIGLPAFHEKFYSHLHQQAA